MYVMYLYIRYFLKKQLIENFKSDSEAVLTIKITTDDACLVWEAGRIFFLI
jgi:hypothetical protein